MANMSNYTGSVCALPQIDPIGKGGHNRMVRHVRTPLCRPGGDATGRHNIWL